MKKDLLSRLIEYGKSDVYPFHMPGHKRRTDSGFAENFPNPFSVDITEIDGFDNLHHPDGILKESMEWAGKVYGADRTYYLVNGSSCGILSAICGSVSHGGTILMSRNCHKSAYHGVFFSHLKAEYIYPQTIPEFGIQGGLAPEDVRRMLINHPETEVVLVVSPTYDGIVSDIEAIAGIVHERGIPLIVDEAHGAHFSFGKEAGFPVSALGLGADVVIQSLHKTLPSLTQTAVMHVKAGFADLDGIDRYVHMFQSSSPSYVLMASIENCIRWMDEAGRHEMMAFGGRLDRIRQQLMEMECLTLVDGVKGRCHVFDVDRSKIVVSVGKSGLTGPELQERLRREYRLEMEMCGPDYVTAITTVADTDEGLERLCRAFMEIDLDRKRSAEGCENSAGSCVGRNGDNAGERSSGIVDNGMEKERVCGWPVIAMTIAQAMDAPGQPVPLNDCAGLVSKEFIYIYPPGIPIVAPGEVLKPELVDEIRKYKRKGLPVQGTADPEVEAVLTVADRGNMVNETGKIEV